MRTHKQMIFGFLFRTTTYLKATEEEGIKMTKDTVINVSNARTFFIVHLKKGTDQPEMAVKIV